MNKIAFKRGVSFLLTVVITVLVVKLLSGELSDFLLQKYRSSKPYGIDYLVIAGIVLAVIILMPGWHYFQKRKQDKLENELKRSLVERRIKDSKSNR